MEIIGLLNLFGSLASLISLYRTSGVDKAKEQIKPKGGNVYFEEINETLILSDTVDIEIKYLKVIDNNILDALCNKVENAKSRFVEALNDQRYTPADIAKEETVLSLEVCEALQTIKRLNRDRLPNIEQLNHAWESFTCGG